MGVGVLGFVCADDGKDGRAELNITASASGGLQALTDPGQDRLAQIAYGVQGVDGEALARFAGQAA